MAQPGALQPLPFYDSSLGRSGVTGKLEAKRVIARQALLR
jgi:hypothetical protein